MGAVSDVEIPIPDRLKKFPLHKGMLVHFTVFVGPDDVPDFKVIDTRNRVRCLQEGLCAICGEKLDRVKVFFGGAKSIASRYFVDGPMHEECALYAAKVCPYLRDETWTHAADGGAKHRGQEGVILHEYASVPKGRPKMAALYAISYAIVHSSEGPVYHAGTPTKIDWDLMPNREDGAK